MRIKKLGPASIASKLGEFLLFDGFFNFPLLDFPDLDNFRNLADFWRFNFPDFLAYFTPLPSNLSTSSLLLFFLEAGLLLSFLLKADLLLSFLLGAGLSNDLIVLNFEMSEVIILLKP